VRREGGLRLPGEASGSEERAPLACGVHVSTRIVLMIVDEDGRVRGRPADPELHFRSSLDERHLYSQQQRDIYTVGSKDAQLEKSMHV